MANNYIYVNYALNFLLVKMFTKKTLTGMALIRNVSSLQLMEI